MNLVFLLKYDAFQSFLFLKDQSHLDAKQKFTCNKSAYIRNLCRLLLFNIDTFVTFMLLCNETKFAMSCSVWS